MKREVRIKLKTDGSFEAVYGDELRPVLDALGGKQQIVRASHVEPNSDGEWLADMSPVGGPVLGPFHLRSEALDAERAWLLEHRGI